MAERTKQMGQSSNLGDSVSYTENDLQLALDDFLEEEKRKEVKPTLFNFQTIAGFVIIFLSLSYLVQQIGLSWGPSLSGLMSALPVIGGVIVTIVGLGIFSRERKKHRKQRRKERREKKHLYNNLEQRERRRKKHRKHEFDSFKSMSEHDIKVDRYALKKNKKLFRSRHDKRIFGVCGGIARYFGVSSTFVRLLFAIGTLLGYGFPIILYIALAVVLPKEPYSLFDVDDI